MRFFNQQMNHPIGCLSFSTIYFDATFLLIFVHPHEMFFEDPYQFFMAYRAYTPIRFFLFKVVLVKERMVVATQSNANLTTTERNGYS